MMPYLLIIISLLIFIVTVWLYSELSYDYPEDAILYLLLLIIVALAAAWLVTGVRLLTQSL